MNSKIKDELPSFLDVKLEEIKKNSIWVPRKQISLKGPITITIRITILLKFRDERFFTIEEDCIAWMQFNYTTSSGKSIFFEPV